jgi:hypothetical protein
MARNVKLQGPAAAGNVAGRSRVQWPGLLDAAAAATAAAAFSPSPGSSTAAAAAPRRREPGKPRGGQRGPGPKLRSGCGCGSCGGGGGGGPSTATLYVPSTPPHTPSLLQRRHPLPARPPAPLFPLSIGAETKATGSGGPGRYPRTPGATGPAPRHSPALRGPPIRLPRRVPRRQTSENWPKTHRMNFLVPRIQDGDVSTAEAAGSKTFTLWPPPWPPSLRLRSKAAATAAAAAEAGERARLAEWTERRPYASRPWEAQRSPGAFPGFRRLPRKVRRCLVAVTEESGAWAASPGSRSQTAATPGAAAATPGAAAWGPSERASAASGAGRSRGWRGSAHRGTRSVFVFVFSSDTPPPSTSCGLSPGCPQPAARRGAVRCLRCFGPPTAPLPALPGCAPPDTRRTPPAPPEQWVPLRWNLGVWSPPPLPFHAPLFFTCPPPPGLNLVRGSKGEACF